MKWLGSPNYDPSSRGIWEVIFPICNLERVCYDNKVRRASCKFWIAQLINENKYSLRESFYGFIRKIETSESVLKNYSNMAHWMWLIQPLNPQPNHPPPNDNRWSQLTTEFSSRCKIKPTPFCSLAAAAPTNIVMHSLLLVHGATMPSLFLTSIPSNPPWQRQAQRCVRGDLGLARPSICGWSASKQGRAMDSMAGDQAVADPTRRGWPR